MSAKVIVVGGGLSGLSAAHTVLERGGNVLLLDKNSFMGGNSTKATSGINGSGTAAQQENNIPDSSAKFFADTKKSARDLARDDLIKVLTYKSGDAVQWLIEAFGLDLSKVSRLGGHSEPRTHRGGAQFPGMTITYALMEKLEDIAAAEPDRAKIIKKAKVTSLIKEGDEVVGVKYEVDGKTLEERGVVVLATGGYAADFSSDSLLKKYRPEFFDLPTTNGDHCTGDGHKMAMGVGAKGIDLEKVQVHPTGLVDPKDPQAKVKFLAAEALRGCGGLLIDSTGHRFVDELQHRDFVTNKMWENNKFPVRLVLNSAAQKEIEWHIKHYAGRGLMKHYKNGYDLAKDMGVDPKVLQKTFEDHTYYSEHPGTDPFNKKFFNNAKYSMDDNFAVALMTPVLHYTMGGLEIGTDAAVHDANEKPIPGLFACGELAGGVHGANRLGGSSLLGCVVFGRVAGGSASSYLLHGLSNQSAAGRLGAIGDHLLETRVRVDPATKSVNLEFSFGGSSGSSAPAVQAAPAAAPAPAAAAPAEEKTAPAEKKEYTAEEVAQHNKENDLWVIIDGQVLDVTEFLPDHPGGVKAIMLYAGKDATEEFEMVHPEGVLKKYLPESAYKGTVKA
ncbi:fumarate reductase (NADH) [Trichosporon asahii var. asahii CBS 2479]|uniref:Fumarate reductase (NADH) n=1 Tax=Trichosporon asahii var. asahii (strain ATCC 90039 / CBS 2479 / JCM 2466 / KCTC 7840 / NBRC 103889/ NCYC 2677 / UAMH 7654) TaxID=1186058 RepID=J6ER73_TRIAS|nr:fumarate reductase (NADH) [Trichosporon asahii var. asahii CBS 2479]EJT45212.1 fumarate reductase (NADH) [Trichosporon asahii var. asahii CBS 2479]